MSKRRKKHILTYIDSPEFARPIRTTEGQNVTLSNEMSSRVLDVHSVNIRDSGYTNYLKEGNVLFNDALNTFYLRL